LQEEFSSETGQVARLEDYLRAIKSRPILVLALPLLFGLGTWLAAESRVETYSASGSLALGPSPVGAVNANLARPVEERESEVVQSNAVAAEVAEDLGLGTDGSELLKNLTVQFVPGSEVLSLSYVGTEPQESADVVNGFSQSYTQMREAQADQFYTAQLEVLESQLTEIRAEVAELDRNVQTLDRERLAILALEPEFREALPNANLVLAEARAARVERNRVLTVMEDSKRTLTLTAQTRQATATVLRSATPAEAPSGVSSLLLAIGGALLGLVAGIAAAFLWERLDNRAKGSAEVSAVLGAPILGEVPSFSRQRRLGPAALIMLSDQGSQRVHFAKEAYRRLRSVLQFASLDREDSEGGFLAAVTSAHPSEGKSVTAANLAVALAQAGKVVVLVSADMRRPTIEMLFGIGIQDDGLSTVLAGGRTDLQLLDTSVDRLFILPAGPAPANPAELLASGRLEPVLDQLRSSADFVVVDTPPVLSVADALVIGAAVDGTLLVVDAQRTDSPDLWQARSELSRAGINVIGGILNRTRHRSSFLSRKNQYAYANAAQPTESPKEVAV